MKRVRFRLMELMKERNIQQMELVEGTGLSYNTIKSYSRNHVMRPDLEIIAKLCEYFECELTDLLVLEDVPSPG